MNWGNLCVWDKPSREEAALTQCVDQTSWCFLRYNVLIKDPRTGAYKVNFAKDAAHEAVRVPGIAR